jgi:hypothetical protein
MIVHLLRKSLETVVCESITHYGTGGLNIAYTRVGLHPEDAQQLRSITRNIRSDGARHKWGLTTNSPQHDVQVLSPQGRHPANVMFMHSPECDPIGIKNLPGFVVNTWDSNAVHFGGSQGQSYSSRYVHGGWEVEYMCQKGCCVRDVKSVSMFFFTLPSWGVGG